ncbi:leucyl/phenylalanyl-tRNA--protein transferase [Ferrovibrio sp.]|uniref:leucyl/phenylalanyl-tRNA--protein transferase n=1 Tax=Ferrovibrio sp. TaxID=1917215 RepID=UPI00311E16D0
MSHRQEALTPNLLLQAYARGYFPMADSAEDPGYYWVYPRHRGILPLERFHLPRRLARVVRSSRFRVVADRNFAGVIAACAEPTDHPLRQNTWINAAIREAYTGLHRMGFAHSIETYDAEDRMVGGLYGVRIGAAFFGESMFSRQTDASKLALVHLVARLKAGGFRLLDTQFVTRHLTQFGALEIPRAEYLELLAAALARQGDFYCFGAEVPPGAALQSITQTS